MRARVVLTVPTLSEPRALDVPLVSLAAARRIVSR
jgi:hypothetical protein